MSFWDSVKHFFGDSEQQAVQLIDDLGTFTQRLQQIFDKWGDIKEEWDALFEPQEVDRAGNWKVVTVKAAQEVLEDIRLGALKDRALQLYQDIKDIINLALHPVGGSAEGDAAILQGAAAFGGKPGAGAGAFRAASLINSVLNFEDRILELEDKVLEVVSLLDVIQDMRDQIEAGALKQNNPQVSTGLTIRARQGRLSHGKTRQEETQQGNGA